MTEHDQNARNAPLADCPYCAGEGTDPATALGICRRCYGTGRIARFLAERTLARWARAHRGAADDDQIEDEVPPGYTRTRHDDHRGPSDGRPSSRRQ